ncbi:spore germination protein KA [Clostridium tetanomorphum]|uniref:spore germination protein n=1 Tax=Clostridium tetanomorphum TaxID=1553 RepID=UPI00044EB4F2|nr:spore germination protein [Clostridium tetanomorphum]KAJ50258.1 spore germination protein [Clostridium tetanomorphum DSM 665]MBP1864399.1 spore germination protein KA [Clostridium tetanomorphum]NRS83845.1 spore germination protein KA [Clostridium tetanomorphum]SQB93237.1 spore germination protein [Clostridium tetanomorphum]
MSATKLLSEDISVNIDELTAKFEDCPDIANKKLILKDGRQGCLFFIKGFINIDLIQRDFIKSIMSIDIASVSGKEILEYLPLLNTSTCYDIDTVISSVFNGKTVLLIDKSNYAIICELKDFEKRSISEPENEKNVRGPHEGFIENIDTNLSIIRKRIKSENLKFKNIILGNETKQKIVIAYINGIANPELLNILIDKVSKINTDGVLDIGYIEQYITDSPNSPFPQYLPTERPDKVVSALLEGRLVILMDGTPFTLIVPVSFWSFIQTPDDYSTRWMLGSFIRCIRTISIITSLILPSLYISATAFQYYLVPLNLLIPLAISRTRVAFPPVVEALVMEFTIEIIREASIRLPTYISATIGVVGGIIIGQAAVNAGIVSSLFIIVVAVTAMSSYVVPIYDFGLTLRFTRFLFLILASFFGIIGVIVGVVFVISHLLSLESLGQPYFMPIIPFKKDSIKDTIIRAPLNFMKIRPHISLPLKKKRGDK